MKFLLSLILSLAAFQARASSVAPDVVFQCQSATPAFRVDLRGAYDLPSSTNTHHQTQVYVKLYVSSASGIIFNGKLQDQAVAGRGYIVDFSANRIGLGTDQVFNTTGPGQLVLYNNSGLIGQIIPILCTDNLNHD